MAFPATRLRRLRTTAAARHWILGYVYEYRAILETSAGQDLVTEWTSSESVAQMDGARLALSLREPELLVA
jgi:hypothetical protein